MSHEQRIAEYFDRCARNRLMTDLEPEERAQVDVLLDRWRIAPGDRVLEPGCGTGRLTEALAPAVGPRGRVTSFDLSGEMLQIARGRGLLPWVHLLRCSVAAIPAPDRVFAKAICFNVFPHFCDPAAALAELHRVLQEGGELWINHLRSREAINAFHRSLADEVRDHQLPDATTMGHLLASAGLELLLLEDDDDLGYCLQAKRHA